MRKAALIFMVCAMFAAVLLPTTAAQAWLQPGLTVTAQNGHATLTNPDGGGGWLSGQYKFTVVMRNMWSRSMNVSCSFDVFNSAHWNGGNQGTGPFGSLTFFDNVVVSTKLHHGTTKIPVRTDVVNPDVGVAWGQGWRVEKRGCTKGPN